MPRKDETKTPQKAIERFIKRHLEGGESVVALSKEYKISRATAYNWLSNHRKGVFEKAEMAGKSPAAIEKQDKLTMRAELIELRAQNRKLRDKLLSYMIRAGEL